MALNESTIHKLLNKLNDLQKQIEAIHNELLMELDSDELSAAEHSEVEAIRKENDYRTLYEWDQEESLD